MVVWIINSGNIGGIPTEEVMIQSLSLSLEFGGCNTISDSDQVIH